jgi:hypothetical protein
MDKAQLPPDPIPPLHDVVYGGPSPYAYSDLRSVTGTRINPHAVAWYRRREVMTSRRGVLSGVHPDLKGWLGDIRSFDPFCKVIQHPINEWPLPCIIPQVSVTGNPLPFPLKPGTYMIDYQYLTIPGKLPEKDWVINLKDKFPEGSELILTFFGGERKLFWSLWTQMGFWRHPFLQNFKAIAIPDFDSYSDSPIPQSLLGERMQMVFANEGAANGHTIIPKVAWRNEDSFRRQIEMWTAQYPKVHTIILNCYGNNINKRYWHWRWLMAAEKYCADKDHIRWIFAGMTPGWVVRELNEIFPKKNYCLLPSGLQFVAAQRKAVDPLVMADKFQIKMAEMASYWKGEVVAEKMARPTFWPTYQDARIKLPDDLSPEILAAQKKAELDSNHGSDSA